MELALKYNLSGKGELSKKSFQQLRLYKVIFGTSHYFNNCQPFYQKSSYICPLTYLIVSAFYRYVVVSLARCLHLTVKSNPLRRLCNSVTKGYSSNAPRVREYGIETDSNFFSAAVRRIYAEASVREYRSSLVHWLDGAEDGKGGRNRRAKNRHTLEGDGAETLTNAANEDT